MTDRNHIEDDMDRIIKLQHELSRILIDAVDPSAGLQDALDLAVEMTILDGVWTWFRHENGGDFRLENAAGLAEPLLAELGVLPAGLPTARGLDELREIMGRWQDVWPQKAAAARELGWHQVAILPIISQGEVVGALGGSRRCTDCVASDGLWVLRAMANAMGSLLANVRHESRFRNTGDNLTRLLDSFSDRMFIVATDGTLLYHNLSAVNNGQACCLGLVGTNIEAVLPEYQRLRQATIGDAGAAGGGAPSAALRADLVDSNGALHPVEVRIEQVTWDDEAAAVVFCRDLAGHLELRQENERLATAIKHVAESIVITDAEGTIQYVNPNFCRQSGCERAEVIGRNLRVLQGGVQDEAFHRDLWQTLRSGKVWTGRITNRRCDGEQFIEDSTISPVRNDAGEITHFVAVQRDVTAEIEFEDRLRDRQKMEAVGTLAGGIAHDFNNILYALLGYVDLARDDIPADHPARAALDGVSEAGDRAARLVAKMLTFGRRSDGQRESVDLAAVVAEWLELVRASLPATIRIETDLVAGGCRILADPTQLHQVLFNLCQNAGQSMADIGGVLRVVVDEYELDPAAAQAHAGLQPARWARIQVIDTGRGIDPAVLERIFEPYFTTRTAQAGNGLGLATVHGIVASHGGRVHAESTPGAGATFTVHLPAETVRETSPAVAAPTRSAIEGRGRIMVIDDEPMVVEVLEKALTRFGFEVSVFADGVEALEVFRVDPDQFDVVITDQTMPNITGFELASQMLAMRPDLPLILTTGYSEKANQQLAREAGIRCFLPKPLKISELGRILVELTANATVP